MQNFELGDSLLEIKAKYDAGMGDDFSLAATELYDHLVVLNSLSPVSKMIFDTDGPALSFDVTLLDGRKWRQDATYIDPGGSLSEFDIDGVWEDVEYREVIKTFDHIMVMYPAHVVKSIKVTFL